jgi:predicted MPP superfamily phosphohydrolase
MKLLLRGAALLAALLILFLGVGLWNATRPPVIVQAATVLQGLPPGARLRVLLLADTHFGHPDMGTGRLLSIVATANAQKPDLILLAGDYMGGKLVDWPKVRLEQALPPLAALEAPMGVYAILGNHDEARWTPRVMARQRWPKLLVNTNVDIGPVVVAGMDSMAHNPDLARTLAGATPGKPVLLLVHEPQQLAWNKRPPGFPVLALAGHTHGGQVVLPLVGSLGEWVVGPQRCPRGRCTINSWPVHVTSGLGTTLLPIRYGVPPEMVLLTITGAAAAPERPTARPVDHSTGRNSGTER